MRKTYKITLIAMLAALATIGRVLVMELPNVQPTTSLLIITAFWLGPISAIAMVVVTTYLSNVIMGMGIWTIWQILSWAIIAVVSGWIGKYKEKIPLSLIALFAALCGYFYGFVISLTMYKISGQFWPYYIAGLPFDTYHAIGNAIFMFLLYPVLSSIFKRYQNKWK